MKKTLILITLIAFSLSGFGQKVFRSDVSFQGKITEYQHVVTTEFTSSAGAGFDTTTAVAYAVNLVNSAGDTVVVEAPAPVAGLWFTVVQSRSGSAKPIYINTTADKLRGAAGNVTLSASLPFQRLVYVNSTIGWVPE